MAIINGPNGEQVFPIKIDGSPLPLDASRLIPVESSISGKTIHYAQSATPEIAVKAVESSRAAFHQWRKTSHTQRRELIFKTADIIESWADRFAAVQAAETSCAEEWAKFNVRLASRSIREIASAATGALTGELPPLETEGAMCLVNREPVGPILAISPWNASMIISSRALAAPILAGCSVVFKASELCPAVHHLLVEAFEAAGLPAGLINVLQASRDDAAAVTEALVGHPHIRKIEFTGSDVVGSIIGQMAGKYLKPVLMELGGKCPAIVLKDADVKLAANTIIAGAMLHHGQICMSTDRIIVVRDIADEMKQALKAAVEERFSGHRAGHAVTRRMAARAHSLLQKAHAAGAEFVVGDGSLDETGSSLEPTIITGVSPDDEITHFEIFAPAAILTVVEDADEAVRVANDTRYGLNASVHGRDVFAALRVARQIEAGQVHINTLTQFDEPTIPIGGTKGSGWGRTNGKYALFEFLEEKTITIHDPDVAGAANSFGKGRH